MYLPISPMKYHATIEARSAAAPRILSAVRHGSATVTMAVAAHSNAATSHAGRASASEDRTTDHWSVIARTTKTPAAAAMAAPTAVDSQATRFFLSGCLLGTRTGLRASPSPPGSVVRAPSRPAPGPAWRDAHRHAAREPVR